MSVSPLRAASRWLDASRSTSSILMPTGSSWACTACATRASSTLLVLRHSCSAIPRSEEHTSELQSQSNLVCRLLLEKKKNNTRDDQKINTKNGHLKAATTLVTACSLARNTS